MRNSVFAAFCLFAFAIVAVDAQTKTVTNVDLDKFREKRLQAEKEFRENYEEMGFPSPEELDRQRQESLRANALIAERLRSERLQRELYEAAYRSRTVEYADRVFYVERERPRSGYVYGYSAGLYPWARFPARFPRQRDGIPWRATPGGIIYEPGGRSSNTWTPSGNTRPRPAFRRP